MDIIQRLTERDPDNNGWLRDLSVSHTNVGLVLQAQGNLTKHRKHSRRTWTSCAP